MKCRRCNGEAVFAGMQQLEAKVQGNLHNFGQVRLMECTKCGSFIHPDDVGLVDEFAERVGHPKT